MGKIKLGEIKEAYEISSGNASSITRNLNYSGVAIIVALCFIQDHLEMTWCQVISLLCFVLSLGVDLSQYIYQTYSLYNLYKLKEKNKHKDEDWVVISETGNQYAWYLFYAKIVICILGFVLLFSSMFSYFTLIKN